MDETDLALERLNDTGAFETLTAAPRCCAKPSVPDRNTDQGCNGAAHWSLRLRLERMMARLRLPVRHFGQGVHAAVRPTILTAPRISHVTTSPYWKRGVR
jgi:hypothetical protein